MEDVFRASASMFQDVSVEMRMVSSNSVVIVDLSRVMIDNRQGLDDVLFWIGCIISGVHVFSIYLYSDDE